MSEPSLLDDPEIPLDDPEIPLDDEPTPVVPGTLTMTLSTDAAPATEPAGLVEVLPAGFELPKLIRFVPDARLQLAATEATKYALSIEVKDAEGLKRADAALVTLRAAQAAITEHFSEPARLSDEVHKSITGKRAAWLSAGQDAITVVGKRIATEQTRLQRIAAEAKRKAQEEEDRKARERAREEAKRAESAKVPAPVVEQMRKAAETATAPPVQTVAEEPPKLTGQTVVKTWKARPVSTEPGGDPNPSIGDMTKAQTADVLLLLQGIIEGRDPITAIEINYSVLNNRAKSDKGTMRISGFEAYEDLGVRAKGGRAK
jgi:hypothetical protein